MNHEQPDTVDLETICKNNCVKAAEAIEKMGGPALAGRKLTERLRARGIDRKVSIGVIWAWKSRDKRGIPIEFLTDVEEESGISRLELRGDIPWNKC